MSLEVIKDYASLISALLSLATLGFLVRFVVLIRSLAKDRLDLTEAKHRAIQEKFEAKIELLEMRNSDLEQERVRVERDLDRTEKWHSRELESLREGIAKSEGELTNSLNAANISLDSLVLESSKGIAENVRVSLESIISEMSQRVDRVAELHQVIDPNQHLELGKGLMAIKRWKEAAEHFDKYVLVRPEDWEVQLSRGVSYANSRESEHTNLAALRAYNEAIAFFLKGGPDNNLKARAFTYRAAALKRLNRLDEAEADLNVAINLATRSYEIRDTIYNLTCIKAMKKDKEGLLKAVHLLKTQLGSHRQMDAIRGHLNDYFSYFAEDKDFLTLISSSK
jgi:Flp pilus assembly protein TadD